MRDKPLTANPLADDEIDQLFSTSGMCGEETIAVAVSGGADSMALMYLLAEWIRQKPAPLTDDCEEKDQAECANQTTGGKPELLILTVDHGLRAEAVDETEFVCKEAAQLGLECELLRCKGLENEKSLQQAARIARYRLMQSVMSERGINSLVTAHTFEDQIETFFMRLLRGSGVDGLAAMAKQTQLFGMSIVRPFLDLPKTRLRASLNERDAKWIEDPSNEQEDFERVRLRKMIGALEQQGLSFENMNRSLIRLGDTKAAINHWCNDWLANNVHWHKAGIASCRFDTFCAAPKDLQVRILIALVAATGGTTPLPHRQKFEQQLSELLDRKPVIGQAEQARDDHLEKNDLNPAGHGMKILYRASLGGALIECLETQGGEGATGTEKTRHWIRIYRERGRLSSTRHTLSPGETLVWDERIELKLCHGAPQALNVGPLSEHDYADLKQAQLEMQSHLPELPAKEITLTCAGFYHQDNLIAVPQLDYFKDEFVLSTNYLPHMDKKEVIQSQFPVN